MAAQLRHDGDTTPVDLADLDEDVRRGRVPADATLCWAPWTGSAYLPLGEIPQLSDAIDAPHARLNAHLRQPHFPWFSVTLTVLLLSAGLAQFTLGRHDPALHERLLQWGGTGLEALLLDLAWWTPWTSQLLHSDISHLLVNLPVVTYCAWRVERALGGSSAALISAISVTIGAIGIALLSDAMVIGSSVLGFGLWGSQIAIGFRYGDALPRKSRRRYGWLNIAIFAPLFAYSLMSSGVSHAGHGGGLIGGVLATLSLTHASTRPRGVRYWPRLAVATAATLFAPGLVGAALSFAPRLAHMPFADAQPRGTGVHLGLPHGMADSAKRFGRMEAWQLPNTHLEPLFCDLLLLAPRGAFDDETARADWVDRLGQPMHDAKTPPPIAPGWTAQALAYVDASGVSRRVVDHRLQRGRWVLRLGYLLRDDGPPDLGARARFYEHIVRTVVVGPPPDLSDARETYARNPDSPMRALALADALARVGQYEAADRYYQRLVTRSDQHGRAAALARFELGLQISGQTQPTDWAQRAVNQAAPWDSTVHLGAIEWWAHRGSCATATKHARALSNDPDAGWQDDARELLRSCGTTQ